MIINGRVTARIITLVTETPIRNGFRHAQVGVRYPPAIGLLELKKKRGRINCCFVEFEKVHTDYHY